MAPPARLLAAAMLAAAALSLPASEGSRALAAVACIDQPKPANGAWSGAGYSTWTAICDTGYYRVQVRVYASRFSALMPLLSLLPLLPTLTLNFIIFLRTLNV